MDVYQEGVRGPGTLFVDGVVGDTIEVHGHGTTCSEGVAANNTGWRKAFFVETSGNDGGFEHVVDVS